MTSSCAPTLPELAHTIEQQFRLQPFGGLWFWQFAVVRPHDEGQQLVRCEVRGTGAQAELVLVLQHASGQGHSAELGVCQPAGLRIDAQGLRLAQAQRLRFGPCQAWAQAHGYRLRTPQSEGCFEQGGAPALFLQR